MVLKRPASSNDTETIVLCASAKTLSPLKRCGLARAVDAGCQSRIQLCDDAFFDRFAQIIRKWSHDITTQCLGGTHSLHMGVIGLHKQSLTAIWTCKDVPLSSALLAIGVWVQIADERNPVLADLRDDRLVTGKVRSRRLAVGTIRAPEGVRIHRVVSSETLGFGLGIQDIVFIVVSGHLVAGKVVLDIADDTVGADVANGVGGLAPFHSGVGKNWLRHVDV
ncbi:hypothetical protein CGRA01v4_04386 [Colletotrichum graminicola]|nr:hypothetical protein CGRA01v4_04386 [Colletotrichum graminicola]